MMLRLFTPLITHPDAFNETALANAAAAAAHLRADLHALALLLEVPSVSSPLGNLLLDIPELARRAEVRSRDTGAALLALLRIEADKRSVRLTTETRSASLGAWGDVAGSSARYADCAVVGWEVGNPIGQMVGEAVVFGSGRPTLIIPNREHFANSSHVAIAWDGSRVAARAAFDALQILPEVTTVSVLSVIDEKPLSDIHTAARFAEVIGTRGFKAQPVSLTAEDVPIAVTLQEQAIARGANLLVMGGFGHSRFRDFVLGGATKGVLHDLRLPVLLSH